MSFVDLGVPCQPLSNTNTNQFREEHQTNRKKTILRIGIITALICLFLTLIIALIYILTNKPYKQPLCVGDINPPTSFPIEPLTSTSAPLLTTDKTKERIIVLNPCLEQNIEYQKWGMPIQNYSLYPIDASLLISTALISIKITISPSKIDCTWSMDIFPMDGRPIPFDGRPTNSVFGFYDQTQNSPVEESNVTTVAFWSGGTGKFLVGFTGAWYGTADVGCQGYGIMKICFSHP